ncbi:MAG: glycosyltransferase, partial [Candidatus Woesearchaeota archaeon]
TPAFAIYKTSVIKNLGGFDENNLTEDLEIGLRLQDRGYNIATSLKGFVYTVVPKNFKGLMKQRIRWYRGNINNLINYRHMFFNKKFGHLGLFVLPVQYLLLALSTPILLSGIINSVIKGMQGISNVFLVNFDISYMLSKVHMTISSNIIFWGLLILSFLIMMKISRLNVKEQVSKLEYVLYIALYPFINVILWVAALAHEIVGAEKKW